MLHAPDRNGTAAPQQDHEAERAYLGCLLVEPDCLRDHPEAVASPGDMYDESLRTVLVTIGRLRDRGLDAGPATVIAALRDAGTYDPIGGDELLGGLLEEVYHARDVAHYAERIRTAARHRRRRRLSQELQALTSAALPDDERIAEVLRELADDRPTGPERFRWHTLADLCRMERSTTWLIDGLLADRQPLMIGGPLKGLKTSLSAAMLLSLTTGRPFLRQWRVPNPVRCGLMTGESGRDNVCDVLCRVAREMDVLPSSVDSILVTEDLPDLLAARDLAAVERTIRDHSLRVLLLDPTYMLMSGIAGDAGNLFAVAKILRPLTDLMHRTDCLIGLCHHTGKRPATPWQPPELADLQYAGFAQWAGQWVMTSRRSPFDAESGRSELWLSIGGRSGQAGLYALDVEEGRLDSPDGRYWSHTITPASEHRETTAADRAQEREDRRQRDRDIRDERDRSRILAALASHPEGATARTLRATVGMSGERFGALVAGLVESGHVEPCEVHAGPQRTPKDGFRPTSGTSGTSGTRPTRPGCRDVGRDTPPYRGGVPHPGSQSRIFSPVPDVPDLDPEADPRDVPGTAYGM